MGGLGGALTINRDVGIKELLLVFAIIGVIYGGFRGIGEIAATVSQKQISDHTIITEEKHADQYEQMRIEQSIIKTDVEVTKERVNMIGEDVKEIKELLKDR